MEYILTLSCPDQKGLVGKICSVLGEHKCNIQELSQFGDSETKNFFMRALIDLEDKNFLPSVQQALVKLKKTLNIQLEISFVNTQFNTVILVSKESHCLNHLLYQAHNQLLPIKISAIISNHESLQAMAKSYNIPYFYFPVTKETKKEQERKILEKIEELQTDLVVLAKYMQILSPVITKKFFGKMINIHHSFLPSFKGAKPYLQAHLRGVKLIGATAHYVTDDLDEGPIIEQEVTRVDHTFTPQRLARIGKDIESKVLSHAILYHTEKRVFINHHKTVVFR